MLRHGAKLALAGVIALGPATLLLPDIALAQSQPPQSTLPLADPVLDANVEIHANRTSDWMTGNSRFMLLETDVTVLIGSYGIPRARPGGGADPDSEQTNGRSIHHFPDLSRQRPPPWKAAAR